MARAPHADDALLKPAGHRTIQAALADAVEVDQELSGTHRPTLDHRDRR
jgi:hypothetical protein